jgi:hypothetical protein
LGDFARPLFNPGMSDLNYRGRSSGRPFFVAQNPEEATAANRKVMLARRGLRQQCHN